jgi:hypothetical protein
MGRVTIGRAESCRVNLPALTASSLNSTLTLLMLTYIATFTMLLINFSQLQK